VKVIEAEDKQHIVAQPGRLRALLDNALDTKGVVRHNLRLDHSSLNMAPGEREPRLTFVADDDPATAASPPLS
jgi:hypothetical protein